MATAYQQWGLGWIPQLPDPRDDLHAFMAPAVVAAALPSRYWPIGKLPAIKYQGQLGSCVSHGIRFAIVAADMAVGTNVPIDPSRLAIYYHGREIENTVNSDSGLSIRDGIKSAVDKGYFTEDQWTYSDDGVKFKQKPPAAADASGMDNRVIKYQSVPQDLTQIKSAIITDGSGALDMDHPRPVPFGFTCYQSMMSAMVAQYGNIPNPGVFDAIAGGHCICLCGWDDALQQLLIANWWEHWGVQGGFGTIGYSYVLSRLASDFWRIISVPADNAPTPPPSPGVTYSIPQTLPAGVYQKVA